MVNPFFYWDAAILIYPVFLNGKIIPASSVSIRMEERVPYPQQISGNRPPVHGKRYYFSAEFSG
ncbi:MAG: hypothetical protein DRH32_04755 [Deltaproteobacteria bacterium]|nr:MAG: hypothetical protein DRH32_04755 [Deltaproteobacteria bacterium]